jgi:hypothetical protein|tara:strand:- start:542 stop:679 length:138 start_codon:yes stop_codon:yes gene_type:complete
MNQLETIRKQIVKKNRLHQAQLICIRKPNQIKYTKIIDKSKNINF